MEGNKDEALRCLQIARNHLASGNVPYARKFIHKSISLYRTSEAEAFLKEVESVSETDKNEPVLPTPTSTAPSSREHKQGRQTRDFTPEQEKAVKRIVEKCEMHDYYKVLNISKDATDADVKKAYKKLALLMHPDKNGAPGADEAFKRISKAFQVLSDPHKRAMYDKYNADPDSPGSREQRFNSFPNGAGFPDEISPEDLFHMFFSGDLGGGFHSATFVSSPGFRVRRYPPRRASPNDEGVQTTLPWLSFLQLLPLILLFIFALSPNYFSAPSDPTPAFSLQEHPPYTEPRYTHSLNIPYFVNPSDFSSFQHNLRLVRQYEDAVESTYVKQLQQHCHSETVLKNRKINEAKGGWWSFKRDEEQLRKAQAMEIHSCERLNQLAEKLMENRKKQKLRA